jgi:hypothetical protein
VGCFQLRQVAPFAGSSLSVGPGVEGISRPSWFEPVDLAEVIRREGTQPSIGLPHEENLMNDRSRERLGTEPQHSVAVHGRAMPNERNVTPSGLNGRVLPANQEDR